jgi:predicted DNA repair protein MutK
LNKAILIPAALILSAAFPWLITPLLIIGGAYLCFEGCEKIAHMLLHKKETAQHRQVHEAVVATPSLDIVAIEKSKIAGAIRTDFILSAEIIVITLGTVATQPFMTRLSVLVAIGMLMTVGVYGLVAAIVKLDDLGLRLIETPPSHWLSTSRIRVGRAILVTAPYLMKFLSFAGTAAMFLVGGGILVHGIPQLHHGIESIVHSISHWEPIGWILGPPAEWLAHGIIGIMAGLFVLLTVESAKFIYKRFQRKSASERGELQGKHK